MRYYMTDAIQQDVLKNEEGETIGTENPRNSLIEQIAQQNLERMQQEMMDEGFEPEKVSNGNDEVQTTPSQPTIIEESQLTQMMVKTKINGIEAEVPLADVVKSYQKDSAASKRLEEAALQKQVNDKRAQELDARESQLKTIQTDNQTQLSDMDATLNEVVSAIYEGDETKTKESLKNLVTAGRSNATQDAPQIDVNAIASQVKTQIEMQAAMKEFGSEYKDVVADPMLRNLADAYLDEELNQDGVSFADALKSAGNRTRAWVQQQAAAMGMTKTQTDDKRSFKESLDNVRSANTRLSSEKADNQPPQSSSVIAEMRKARGQPN